MRAWNVHGRTALRLIVLMVLGIVTAPPAALSQSAHRAIVERVEWEVSDTGARVIVVVKGRVDYSTHTAGASGDLPPRAYVDLKPARLGSAIAQGPIPVNDRLVRRIRIGQFNEDTARIVVDLAEPAFFHVTTAERPTRLILKLVPPRDAKAGKGSAPARADAARARAAAREPSTDAASQRQPQVARADTVPRATPSARPRPTASASPRPTARPRATATASPRPTASPSPRPTASPSPRPTASPTATPRPTPSPSPSPEPTSSPRRYTVVLDPGHGGKDPGARGVTGDQEKSVTLAIAREVAVRLEKDPSIDVVLTRDSDETVGLEQRTALANARGADLFVSIHANASESPEAVGVETYTLNNTDDRATIRLAALENGLTLTGAVPDESDLAYILSDLLQTGKEDESIALAEAVQGQLVRYLRGRWRDVSDLGVKKGPFYVLVGAYMPCVLVEVGFLTHPDEGPRVASPRYQRDVAEGIRRGIRAFLAAEPASANL